MIVDRTDAAIDRVIADLDGGAKQRDLYTVGRSLVLEIAIRSLFGERLAARSEEIGALFQRELVAGPQLRAGCNLALRSWPAAFYRLYCTV